MHRLGEGRTGRASLQTFDVVRGGSRSRNQTRVAFEDAGGHAMARLLTIQYVVCQGNALIIPGLRKGTKKASVCADAFLFYMFLLDFLFQWIIRHLCR
jgi:hypothetical protein